MTPSSMSPTTQHPSVPVVSAEQLATANQSVEADQDESFVDRRQSPEQSTSPRERRQFGNTHRELSSDGRELALAIDRYKVDHHRRYLTCDELLGVIATLGYAR